MTFSFGYKCLWLGTVLLCVLAGGYFLYQWFTLVPSVDIVVNLPGKDGRPEGLEMDEDAVDLSGILTTFDGAPEMLPGFWPRFRGADMDNIVKDAPPLANAWPATGPPLLWTIELGEGHAAPVVWEGRVLLIDYDEANRADVVRCFSLASGKELWNRAYRVSVKRNHGMSRTVPALAQGRIVTMGPRCHVVCLDAATGAFHWGIDLQKEYGAVEPLWYTGQCPLIDGDTVVLAPCGPDALLIGVDLMTGQVRWKTPNPAEALMSHSSIMPMTLAGKRMYVYSAIGAVFGVDAEPSTIGALLWQVPWKARVIAPSPLKIAEDRILAVAGYGEGSLTLRIAPAADGLSAEVLTMKSPREGIACEQQTPILYNDRLYTVMPKDAGSLREQFVCYTPDGELLWSSGTDNRYGLGPFILADNKFFVLKDDGTLNMLDASAPAFQLLGQARIIEGHDAWGPIALAGNRMLLRDSTRLVCLNVGKEIEEVQP